jgi:UPF0176 protein
MNGLQIAANKFQIITFYEFRQMPVGDDLVKVQESLRGAMREHSIKGTIILASEGFNSTICGHRSDIKRFIYVAEKILGTKVDYKSSFHDRLPFRRIDVKIKPEIVTLKRGVNLEQGKDTHIGSKEWNRIISEEGTLVLDARNDYEYQTGTFRRAVNPKTAKFSELPEFVSKNLDPEQHKRIAMFCTGGIRCEKFAPFLKQLGFEEVYQLKGGILKYLDEIPPEESLWEGECFVFDDRVTVDDMLRKGKQPDLSQAANETPSN